MANVERNGGAKRFNPAIRRGWPGGDDRPGDITSRDDPRFARVVAEERRGLPQGVRRGYPGGRV